MDPENPKNNIRIEWSYVRKDPISWKEFSSSRLFSPNQHFGDTAVGVFTWIGDLDYVIRDRNRCLITGKTFRMLGLGEVVLIMLDLGISRGDEFKLMTWSNKKKKYKQFEWHYQNGYIHEWDVDKNKWPRNSPRVQKALRADIPQETWLAEMDALAKEGKRFGGNFVSICTHMADVINSEDWWRIQLV